ncbi:MAG: hypothetical protein EBZ69_05505 [Alphaproteobacteria bacterium]|nr:hypothetical protein [Alphaproteobacteria bacterium]NDC56248.1 hypothetical protein [Alphaproteobacteria bacterium]NDG04891.1 hypothetical protein [Alphaproteobacteria bacterium]
MNHHHESAHHHQHQHDLTCYSLLALSFAVFLFFAFQMQNIMTERHSLQQMLTTQEPQLTQLKELQDKLDKLAVGTQQLAEAGNKNAVEIVEEYKKQGITFKSQQQQGQPQVPPGQPSPQAPSRP